MANGDDATTVWVVVVVVVVVVLWPLGPGQRVEPERRAAPWRIAVQLRCSSLLGAPSIFRAVSARVGVGLAHGERELREKTGGSRSGRMEPGLEMEKRRRRDRPRCPYCIGPTSLADEKLRHNAGQPSTTPAVPTVRMT